jgi:hypothetical protein
VSIEAHIKLEERVHGKRGFLAKTNGHSSHAQIQIQGATFFSPIASY